jgi:arylsulfatase A-like enzyme
MSKNLNVIFIQMDSLNRHFLQTYGNDWVKTPNLETFAKRSAVFDNHYLTSAPCMPARRDIWTGTEEFWWRGWGPLEPWDRPIAFLACKKGVTSHLITDHYHFFEWGSHSYTYDFHGYDFIRGHEADNWRSDPIRIVPDWAVKMLERRTEGLDYLRNVQDFEDERDFFGPKVMLTAAQWLDRCHSLDQFYLHIDCFDVHEPFHIPDPYRSLYSDDNYRKYNPWPRYGRLDTPPAAISPEELQWVRAQYAGKITMVDKWLGKLLERLDRYNLWDRTCVIITSDHGHFLGDHGYIGKPNAPIYDVMSHLPLMIWHPDGIHNGKRVEAITQTVDLYATTLEMLGIQPPDREHIHSQSLLPLVLGKTSKHRKAAVYAFSNFRSGVSTDKWTLLRDHDPRAAPAYMYTNYMQQVTGHGWFQRDDRPFSFPDVESGFFIPGVDSPVWRVPFSYYRWSDAIKIPRDDLLFNNVLDPGQEVNLAEGYPEVIKEMEDLMRERSKSVGAPEEQLIRLRL